MEYCGILLVLAVLKYNVPRILPYSPYLGVRYLRILMYLTYDAVRNSGILSVPQVFKGSVPKIH